MCRELTIFKITEPIILIFFLVLGVFCIIFLSPPLGGFADEASRIGDAIVNAKPQSLFGIIMNKELWLALHPPLDYIFRALSIYPFVEFFSISNKSIIILQKCLSFIFLSLMSFIFIKSLVNNKDEKNILIITLIVLPTLYIFQLGSIYSLTSCTAGFFLYLSFYYLIKSKNFYDIIKSSLLISIATQFRPEAILFAPAVILYILYFYGFFKSSLSGLIIIFPVTLRLFFKKMFNGDISYFKFSDRYFLPDYNFLNSISLIIEKSHLSFYNFQIIIFILISLFLFFLVWNCMHINKYNNKAAFIFIILIYITYLTLLLIGYNFGIGRPEPRNIIYLIPLFVVPFAIYINNLSLKIMSSSMRKVSLIIIIFLSCVKSVHTYSYFHDYHKYHMTTAMELDELLNDINLNEGILIDHLGFREWALRAHFITPNLVNKFCSYDRCKKTDIEITKDEINPFLRNGGDILPKLKEFNFRALNFIFAENPNFIVTLQEFEWNKFDARYSKINSLHHSIVYYFTDFKAGKKLINFNFTELKNHSYTLIRSTKHLQLYKKASN